MSDYWNDDVESEDTDDIADYDTGYDAVVDARQAMTEWTEEPEPAPTLPEPEEPVTAASAVRIVS